MKKLLVILSLLFLLNNVFAAPWDFLRIPLEVASIINPIISIILVLLAVSVAVISFLAYYKKGSRRLLIIAGAFSLFLIKSVLGLIDLYVSPGIFMNFAVQGIFDFLIILLLFIALFKKG